VLLLLGAVAACAARAPGEPAAGRDTGSGVASSATRVKPAFDLAGVARRTSLAFRDDGGHLAAAGDSFVATVRGGVVAVRPRIPMVDARVAERTSLASEADELTLETVRIARGDAILSRTDGAPTSRRTGKLERDGSVTIAHEGVTERLENAGEGVEQSWSFERAPAGRGDLVVSVRASGAAAFTRRTDHGLHFAARSGLGLRYGTATWVDASGKRTTVVPSFVDGAIVLTVPAEVVSASTYPAVLDPTVGAETAVDTPVSGSSASGDQYNARVTSMGTGKGYLAVWYDRRGVRPALYAARIASNGTLLDDTGIPIATGVGSTVPSISHGGDGFLVTWSVSYVDLYQFPGIYAVRLDAQGMPVEAPVAVVANESNIPDATAAFDGTNWLVTWQRYAGGTTSYDIYGARIPRTGPVLDATPIAISRETEAEQTPRVTFDGTDFMVTFRTYNQIFGRKVGKDGVPQGTRLLLATSAGSSVYNFETAWDGTQHLLVWSDYMGLTSYDVFSRRVDRNGTPIDVAGNVPLALDATADDRPRVAWDGTNFIVTWLRGGTQLVSARLSPGAAFVEPPVVVATGTYFNDSWLASDGSGSLLVSREFASGLSAYDVTGVFITRPPAAAAPFIVSKAANSETEPVVAHAGGSYVAAWLDTRDGRPGIYGTKLGAAGQPGVPVRLVSDAKWTELGRPRIASDGTGYLLVFYGYDSVAFKRGIRGLRIDANGAPDPAGAFEIHVPPSDFAREPDVAFDGTNYLVAWEHTPGDGSTQSAIAAVRVPKTGTVVVDKDLLRIAPGSPVESRLAPTVAFDGTSYYVAWVTSRPSAGSGIQVTHIYGTRVSREGTTLDGEQPVCTAFLLQRAPRVTGDRKAGGFMVVWEDYRTALDSADVYGARISAEGQNLDGTSGLKIAAAAHDESRPRVTSSAEGTNYIVAWRDLRSKQTYDIYGSWVSRAGTVFDPTGLSLSAEGGDEDAPWLETASDGKLMLAYQRLDPRTGYGSYRVRARSIDPGAKVGTQCQTGDECASRSCANGVCCSSECGGCGECNVTAGSCTPRAAGTESPTCPGYRCKGTLECPATCEGDQDCAANATCDPASKTCVSRIICIDDKTLKDLSGKLTDCAPFKCIGDACRSQCGSVDDCAVGFVCDFAGRCGPPPTPDDGGCAAAPLRSGSTGSRSLVGGGVVLAGVLAGFARRIRKRRPRSRPDGRG